MDMHLPKAESETVEFQESLRDRESLARTLCAFANGSGGRLFIGINDRGQVRGLGKEALQRAEKEIPSILNRLQPVPRYSIVREEAGYHRLLVVAVEPLAGDRCFYQGQVWIRKGKSTLPWGGIIEPGGVGNVRPASGTYSLPITPNPIPSSTTYPVSPDRMVKSRLHRYRVRVHRMPDGLFVSLNVREQKTLEILRVHRIANASAVARQLGVSVTMALRCLNRLVAIGYTRRSGRTKGTVFALYDANDTKVIFELEKLKGSSKSSKELLKPRDRWRN